MFLQRAGAARCEAARAGSVGTSACSRAWDSLSLEGVRGNCPSGKLFHILVLSFKAFSPAVHAQPPRTERTGAWSAEFSQVRDDNIDFLM